MNRSSDQLKTSPDSTDGQGINPTAERPPDLPLGIGRKALIFIGILTATMLIATAVSMLLPAPPIPPGSLNTVVIGLQLSLASLAAIYFSVARRQFRFRLVATAILILVSSGALLVYSGLDLAAGLVPTVIALLIVIVLETIKFCFGSFTTLKSENESFIEGLQFQISHLFVVTTVVAVLFGVGRLLWPTLLENSEFGSYWLIYLMVAAVPVINTLALVWALMGNKVAWRILIATITVVGVLYSGMMTFTVFQTSPFRWFGMEGIPCVASGIMLLLLRLDGFRFVVRPGKEKR